MTIACSNSKALVLQDVRAAVLTNLPACSLALAATLERTQDLSDHVICSGLEANAACCAACRT